MASLIWWTRVWASSERWWRTGKPGVLQSTGSQRIGHDLVTEQQVSPHQRHAVEHPLVYLFCLVFSLWNNFICLLIHCLLPRPTPSSLGYKPQEGRMFYQTYYSICCQGLYKYLLSKGMAEARVWEQHHRWSSGLPPPMWEGRRSTKEQSHGWHFCAKLDPVWDCWKVAGGMHYSVRTYGREP